MKKHLIILLCGLAVGVLLLGIVCVATGGMVATAGSWFDHMAAGDYASAYALFDEKIQSKVTERDFIEVMSGPEYHWENYDHLSWSSRSRTNNTGRLEGVVVSTDGSERPVTVELMKKDGTWQITGLDMPPVE